GRLTIDHRTARRATKSAERAASRRRAKSGWLSSEAMLVVKELTKRFQDRVAVDALGFEVRAGEILGLVGPNGAGKTTTLRCVAGILEPDAGEVAIDGVDLAADPLAAKRRLGLVPDEPHLFARLS